MAKTKPVGIGLVGCGRAGWGMHCNEIAGKTDMFEIVAACDILPERRERIAGRLSCPTYADIKDLLADPNVELVDVATRSPEHYPHAVMALKTGKHVWLEKPMTLDVRQAKSLKTLAAKSKGQLFIRHNRRFDPDFVHVREIIKSGILGDVYEIKLCRHGYARRDDWQTVIECGGGQLLNWGPHIIDHGLRLLESPVKAIWSNLKKIAALGDAEDHLKIILTGENGRVVDIEISGGAAIGQPVYTIFGTKGALTVNGRKIQLRYLDPKKKLPPRKLNTGMPGDHFGTPETLPWVNEEIDVNPSSTINLWDAMYESIRRRKKFPITLDEAIQVMDVITKVKKGTQFEKK